MTTLKVSDAKQQDWDRVIETARESHEPVLISGEKANAILISEEDRRAIQETLYLTSIPGMVESIQDGLKTPPADCGQDPSW